MRSLLLCCCIALTGCSSNPVVIARDGLAVSPDTGKPLEKIQSKVYIDQYLLEPCPDLKFLVSDNPTPKDVLLQHKEDVLAYTECVVKQQKLVGLVKDAFNIK